MATTKQSEAIKAKRIAAEAKVAELKKLEAEILKNEKERGRKNREKVAQMIGLELMKYLAKGHFKLVRNVLPGIVEKMPKADREKVLESDLWKEIFVANTAQSGETAKEAPEATSEATTTPEAQKPEKTAQKPQNTPPNCPTCGGEMALRKSSRGEFWGCKGFPACKGTLST